MILISFQLYLRIKWMFSKLSFSVTSGSFCLRPVKTFDLEKPSCLDDVDITKIEWTKTNEDESSENIPNLMIETTRNVFIFKISFSRNFESEKDFSSKFESEKDFSVSISEQFCHDGHRSDISQSISNLTFRNLFFSADVKNNLHAWAFNEK